jgi:hypothetical protein
MSQELAEIALQLKNKGDTGKKIQLIYAFNGSGKTRLSREFKNLITPKFDGISSIDDVENFDDIGETRKKILYYNAFTEDLFYWDNDLSGDAEPKLKIQPNSFTDWVLKEQGQESNFIWSIFYTLLEQVISILNTPEPIERETDQFNQLEYVFIDDPVSSLDENHLIELAVNLAGLIKSSQSDLKFIITTHNPLFYNVLYNELNRDEKSLNYKAKFLEKYRLEKQEDGQFQLEKQSNDSPFSYHLFLMSELKIAIDSGQIKKYHFNFLRNILEKTSTFLGYKNWVDILPKTTDGNSDPYISRIINISSHSKHSGEEVADLRDDDKRVLKRIVNDLIKDYRFWQQEELPSGTN